MSVLRRTDACFYNGDNTFGPAISYTCRSFDFTLLFEQAFLSLVPSLCLIFLSPVRIFNVFPRNVKTLATPVHATKLTFACFYACAQVALLVLWALPSTKRTNAAIPAGVFSLLASVLMCFLSHLEHRKSIRPSSLLNLYLFLTVFFDAVQLRTLWMIDGLAKIALLFSVSLGFKLVILVLEALEKGSYLTAPYQTYWRSPESLGNIYNTSLFWWLNRLFLLGFKNVLLIDHLYELDSDLQSGSLASRIQKKWRETGSQRKHALVRSLVSNLRWPVLAPIFPRLALIGFKYSQPFLLNRLFILLDDNSKGGKNEGYGLIAATAIIYIGIAIANGKYKHLVYRSITMIRGSLVSLIYAKSLQVKMNTAVEGQAKPITLMSTDVDGICDLFDRLHELWACPSEVIIGTYLLARQVGVGCIIPIFMAVASVATNTSWVGRQMGPKRKVWNQAIEKRIAVTSSALQDIKSVKMIGLTERLQSLIQSQRVFELRKMAGFRWFNIYMNLVASITSTFAMPFLLMIYSLKHRGVPVNAAAAYNIMALLDLMTGPLASLLASIPSLMSSVACFSRIQEYLLSDTVLDDRLLGQSPIQTGRGNDDIELEQIARNGQDNTSEAIVLRDWSVGYSENTAVVRNVTTQIPSGKITMLIGPVGSGKTSFLLGLLGEIRSINGFARMSSSDIGYCQQSAWLTNDIIRNVITGHVSVLDDHIWYNSVVKACCLDVDIAQFPDAHDTLIGSRGLTLSGGQRQRVALARAIYSRKSILLLDDVFSALDAKTEQVVFDRLFSAENGLLRKHRVTVILATHAVSHLHAADHIIALGKDGSLVEEGSFKELVTHKGYVHSLEVEEKLQPKDDSGNEENVQSSQAGKATAQPAQINDDARRIGDWSVYKYYFQQLGWRPLSVLLVAQFLQSAFWRFPQAWVQIWSNTNGQNNGLFIAFLFVFACGKWLANLVGSAFFWIHMVPEVGTRLHSILLSTIMRAPLAYHSSTDSGITLNRFSQDMTIIDSHLPMAALPMVMMIFVNLWSFGYIIYGAYYLAAFLPALIGILYVIQKIYLRTSRQLRFLDIELKSPLFTHFSETFEGLVTIRAFRWQQNFVSGLRDKLDVSQRPFYLMYCIQRWLNLSLDMFVAAVAVLLVTFATQFRQHTSSAAVSIALLNIISLSSALSAIIAIWTSLETSIGAIARVKQLETDVKPESDPTGLLPPPTSWPASGSINFCDFTAAYNETSPAVLHGINLSIKAGEKIGICGRTGSGKSSLVSVLFRLLPITNESTGSIKIDGLDITNVPRSTLRSSTIAIPQEPLLFSGDVRFNIAPHSAPYPGEEDKDYSSHVVDDAALISALALVQLWEVILERGGLSAAISSLGLSHGQKQLFCLARAIVRKNSSRILILDEATSSVDKHTDAVMRKVIAEQFSDHTVISVAHRLSSLVDCDRVVVMDSGQIVEVGSAEELMNEDSGRWRELWNAQA